MPGGPPRIDRILPVLQYGLLLGEKKGYENCTRNLWITMTGCYI